MDTGSKTAKAILGIALRRYEALTKKLDWENLSIDELQSIDDESKGLVEKRRTGSIRAGAWLARPKPTPGELDDRLIEISERTRAEIERRKQAHREGLLEKIWNTVRRKRANPVKDAIRRAMREDPRASYADIAEGAGRYLSAAEFRSHCPKGWRHKKSLTEAFNDPALEDAVKTFISKLR